jgi:hypothetical protein
VMQSVVRNCYIEMDKSNLDGIGLDAPGGALFTFPNDGGDCFVHLDGFYITPLRNRGVRGQARLWVETKILRLRWRLRSLLPKAVK